MALGNVLVSGSYTVIKKLTFDKHDKDLMAFVVTYDSSLKNAVLATFDIRVSCDTSSQCEVVSRVVSTPPANPVVSEKYLIPSGATGVWSDQADKILYWSASNTWEELTEIVCVKVLDEDKLYFKSVTGWVFNPSRLTATEFDDWFSVSAVGGVDNNILKRCYEYLKSRPEFSGATDL